MAADFSSFETGSGGSANIPGHGQSIDEEAATVAGGSQWNPLTAAALVGGAVAATAGAYLGAKAIARRNAGKDGRINSVLCTAITAGDVAADKKQH
jgi:hypothetical protein